jgi:hypothetical protein
MNSLPGTGHMGPARVKRAENSNYKIRIKPVFYLECALATGINKGQRQQTLPKRWLSMQKMTVGVEASWSIEEAVTSRRIAMRFSASAGA